MVLDVPPQANNDPNEPLAPPPSTPPTPPQTSVQPVSDAAQSLNQPPTPPQTAAQSNTFQIPQQPDVASSAPAPAAPPAVDPSPAPVQPTPATPPAVDAPSAGNSTPQPSLAAKIPDIVEPATPAPHVSQEIPMPDSHDQPIFMQESSPAAPQPPAPQPASTPAPEPNIPLIEDETPPAADQVPVVQPPPVFDAAPPAPEPAPAPVSPQDTIPQPEFMSQPLQQPVSTAPSMQQQMAQQRPVKKRRSKLRLFVWLLVSLLITSALVAGVLWFVNRNNNAAEVVPDTPVEEVTVREYTSATLEFKTQIPSDWTDVESQEDGLDLVEFSHPTVRDNGTALASVAVIRLRNLDPSQTAASFYETYQSALAAGFDEFSETSNQELEIDNLPAKKVEADVTLDGVTDKAIFYLIFAGGKRLYNRPVCSG